jgi:hypothetical protein
MDDTHAKLTWPQIVVWSMLVVCFLVLITF